MADRSPRMISLGFGKWARGDRIYALEPLEGAERGHGRRTRVWVDGVPDSIVASLSAASTGDSSGVTPMPCPSPYESIRYTTMAQLLSRVLVVDDDEGIRRFAARALGHAGYQAVTASDGSEAIRLVEAEPRFDLFVIDVMMPGMRGDELARRLHDRDPEIKVLYFTGYADQFFALRPMLRENETVLVKPVTLNEFLEAVSHRIQRGA